MRRRDFLTGGALVAASAFAPRIVRGEGSLISHLARPQDLGTPLEYFDRLVTPTDVFFVRSHFGPPALDRARKVRIEGARTLELSLHDLRAFPEVTLTAVLQCAGNGRALHRPRVPGVQWVHGAMGQAAWTGVRLADVLARAGIPANAAYVQLEGYDRPPLPTVPAFVRSVPLARALDPTTLLAYRMNGEPLTLAHGAPLRVVVARWAGDHWMKWLRRVRVQPAEAEGFYMQTAYKMPAHPVAPGTAVPPADMRSLAAIPVKSLIARPADSAILPPGPVEIVGVALSGIARIERVEVSLDDGATWAAATLEGEPGAGRWQVFRARFERRPGTYRAMARAADAEGNAQPREAAWNPSGYFWNGWHTVGFRVAA